MDIHKTIPNVLTISSSDSSGGTGIQADIKTLSCTGSYACSVVTALTAQNTQGVQSVLPISANFIHQQLESVFNDIQIDVVKIGMLSDISIIQCVVDSIKAYRPPFIILDPVMISTTGHALLEDRELDVLITELFPLVDMVTLNLSEAALLIGQQCPASEADMLKMVGALRALSVKCLLLKGGHLSSNQSIDLLIETHQVRKFSTERIYTHHSQGTGCTLSAALASFIAQGQSIDQALISAKKYLIAALLKAKYLNVGEGAGPLHHAYKVK